MPCGRPGCPPYRRATLLSSWTTLFLPGPCKLDLVLLSERLGGPLSSAKALYPANALRNQALARARSKLVLQLDVDLMPKRGLHAHLLRSALPKLLTR